MSHLGGNRIKNMVKKNTIVKLNFLKLLFSFQGSNSKMCHNLVSKLCGTLNIFCHQSYFNISWKFRGQMITEMISNEKV